MSQQFDPADDKKLYIWSKEQGRFVFATAAEIAEFGITLNDLNDVDTTGVAEGDVLKRGVGSYVFGKSAAPSNLVVQRENNAPTQLALGGNTLKMPDLFVSGTTGDFIDYDIPSGVWTVTEAGLYAVYVEVDLPAGTSTLQYLQLGTALVDGITHESGVPAFMTDRILALDVDDTITVRASIAVAPITPSYMFMAVTQLLKL